MSFAALLRTNLELERVTETTDDMGGATETWASQGFFPARIRPATAAERVMDDKVMANATHVVYAEPFDIRENDRINWGDLWYFQVLGIKNPSEAYHHLEILVSEIS